MTVTVIVMIIIGSIFIFASFFLAESFYGKEENVHADLLTVPDDYELSERERSIIKRKIEDVIVQQARDILYETNESLSNMANEKTMALGDYAVTVCDEIERNHKEVMFLYSMLDDKQKEIMKTVQTLDQINHESKNNHNTKEESVLEEQLENAKRENGKAKEKMLTQKIELEVKTEMEEDVEDVEELENVFEEFEQEQIALEDVLDEMMDDEFEKDNNSNDIILEMYRNGESIVSIAKELGLGVGEVRLVIDLYQGE